MPMNEALRAAVRFAQAHESRWPRDPAAPLAPGAVPWGVHHGDPPPFNRLRGPVHARGAQSGVVWQHGDEIAAWGEPARADLTFSVAKSYLALLAGIAQRDGLLPDEDACVADRLPGIGFDSAHNRAITWTHLLTQTSEWEGTCFGIPDTVDRWRKVALDPHPPGGPKGGARPLQAPGSYWEYNDVRINQLALALLHLFGKPLPKLFLEEVLVPLGGGEGFAWDGYDDSWIELPLVGRAQSVPGGSHWGGGVSISARDQARIGQMMLDGGAVVARTIVARDWIERMATPSPIAPFYGRLLWLNRDGTAFPGASTRAFVMQGAGEHQVWIDPELDSVVVLRWLDAAHAAATFQRFADALRR
jgi:CubicO group peptidase (beta-lactamase class C family)